MNIKKLMSIQNEFDNEHGWTPTTDNFDSLIHFINRDLVGLFGEVGELANIIKKINLEHDAHIDTVQNDFNNTFKNKIEEEIIDSFIYIIRLASHLNLDLEMAYLKKLTTNKNKFKKYKIK